MVATFLQDDLAEELKRIFTGFQLKAPATGELTDVHVYKQNLPIPAPVTPSDEDLDPSVIEEGLGLTDAENAEDPYPYALVRVTEGKIEKIDGEQAVEVFLLFGVFDDDLENQGHKDILNMIQKVYERFSKNAILAARYECVMPINWALQEEESYPYYIGGMTLNFVTHPIRREDPYA